MPGALLNTGSTVFCLHSGQARADAGDLRVKVDGKPVVVLLQAPSYTVTGCTLPPPSAGNGPCAKAKWTSAATRVRASGKPVLLQDSQATCLPSGTGLKVTLTQTRVRGQ